MKIVKKCNLIGLFLAVAFFCSFQSVHAKARTTLRSPLPPGGNNLGGVESVDPDDDTRRGEFDSIFPIPVGIDTFHHEIHEGEFFVSDAVDTSMALNDTLILAFKTPNTTKQFHLLIEIASKSSAHVDILEGSTWNSSSGSQNPVFNRKRDSSNTTDVLEDTTGSFIDTNNIILNPVNVAGGTEIHDFYTFIGINVGGIRADIAEIILNPNTTYAFVLTADAGSNAGHIILNWYEHVPE